jgi:hypothetical protein
MTDDNNQVDATVNPTTDEQESINEALFETADSMDKWAATEKAATQELNQTIAELEQQDAE